MKNLTHYKNLLTTMLIARERDIRRRFLALPKAERLDCGAAGAGVYVPGWRDDRALLVAHTDTVFSKPIKVQWSAHVAHSKRKSVGIGADDRAGCAALWLLRQSGHSLLLCPSEESGCLGSSYIAKHYDEKLSGHTHALQFDRRGA